MVDGFRSRRMWIVVVAVLALLGTGTTDIGRAQAATTEQELLDRIVEATNELNSLEETTADQRAQFATRSEEAAAAAQADHDAALALVAEVAATKQADTERIASELLEEAELEAETSTTRLAELQLADAELAEREDDSRAAYRDARADRLEALTVQQQAVDTLDSAREKLGAVAANAYVQGRANEELLPSNELSATDRAVLYAADLVDERIEGVGAAKLSLTAAVERAITAAGAQSLARKDLDIVAAMRRALAGQIVEVAERAADAEATIAEWTEWRGVQLAEIERERTETLIGLDQTIVGALAEIESTRSTELIRLETQAEERQNDLRDQLVSMNSQLGELRLQARLAAARSIAPTLSDLDFSQGILDAFLRASRAYPGCGLHWSILAGVSKVESHHGRYGGGGVDDTGETTVDVIGPVLDGTQFLHVPDTDGGLLDGDPIFDRAVGPMQFIPSSWAIYGRDGDNDGVANPHDYDDAALAAATLLCWKRVGLEEREVVKTALLSYNRSPIYGEEVLSWAAAYDAVRPGLK